MKKIKSFVAITLVIASLASCSKEESLTTEVQNKDILSFNSEQEMNAKIAEIKTFKANQEAIILEQILKRNNLKAPSAEDFKNIDNSKALQLDEKAILEDVKFYHNLKLEAIYAERAHFGFTSIQSIADEINFTKLINKEIHERLIEKNTSLIEYKNNLAQTLNYNLSLVSNLNGNYIINTNSLSIEKFNSNSNNRSTGLTNIKEGILVTNGYYTITYHVGISTHKDLVGFEFYGNYTQNGSFINGALYPTWFYTNSGSSCTFSPYGVFDQPKNNYVPFIVSAADIIRNDVTLPNKLGGNMQYNIINLNQTNNVSGTYVTVINGQFISIVGNKNLNN